MSVDETAIDRARAQHIRDGTIMNYRIEDFCAVFGVARRTTYDLIAVGEIEAIKIGTRTVITAESARAWRNRCPRVKAKVSDADA
jgi:excisionase family DNA binding protein